MIPVPSGVQVWLAVGRTDMRKGMNTLALQVQEALHGDPHAGDLYVFRGGRGDLIKILWHDGLGMSLYAKRLEKGRFIWPSPADGAELEATATEDALAAEAAAVKAGSIPVKSFERKKPVRTPLPAHLPRERVVIPAPCSCPSCGGKLAKLGEDITETLEVIPRQWKVIQTVREKFSCRVCEGHHATTGHRSIRSPAGAPAPACSR